MKDENVSETSERCFNLAYSRIHPLLSTVCVKTITADRLYIQMKLVYWLNKYCAIGTKSYIANVQGQA